MARKISLLYNPDLESYRKSSVIRGGGVDKNLDLMPTANDITNEVKSTYRSSLSENKRPMQNWKPVSGKTSTSSNFSTINVNGHSAIKAGSWTNFSTPETLKENSSVDVGGVSVKVTDPYAMRNWSSRKGHSTGIDVTTSNGNAIAFQDCVVEKVSLHGNGEVIKPSEGSAAGYYVTVKNADGSRTQYMHLDPFSSSDIKSLEGKKLKRGDSIWGYLTGSGSMTGPHVKVRHFGESSKVNIDPSLLILGKNYSFIPDKKGNNILG